MMNSREIVRRTLDYDYPERVARSFGDNDFYSVGSSVETHAAPWEQTKEGSWRRTDEWGNVWSRVDDTSKGEVIKGILDDISALDGYEFPDYSRPEDYQMVSLAEKQHPDKWICGGLPGFAFNIARKMRRLDQYLMDIMLERERMHELHDRIDAMLEDMIRNYGAAGAHSVMFPEDWGTQSQTLIRPEIWREEFFPRFEKLCGIAHECGLRVMMHSCGNIAAIVPWLIEAGIDVLQFDQPDLHGIDTLASCQENSRITFWCPVDIQQTLQKKDEEIIRAKAREMLDKLWKGRGGFIAGYYGDNASIGLDPQWQEYACGEFMKHGTHSRYSRAGGRGAFSGS
ncbi:MAG: uroporphyrinogen decarboxylase family protein [Kiritimatiellia bacterium]